jgi:hypothetical protein
MSYSVLMRNGELVFSYLKGNIMYKLASDANISP